MSQAGLTRAGGGSGSPIETLTGDTGGAVPPDGAFNINLLGGTGITTTGNPGTTTITFSVTGAVTGTATTVGAVNADVITFPLGAVAGTYVVTISLCAFEAGTPSGAGYGVVAGIRTTGAAGTLTGFPDYTDIEEASLVPSDVNFIASANNGILRVTGVAGLTIDWKATAQFTLVT